VPLAKSLEDSSQSSKQHQNQGCWQPVHQTWHCRIIPFPPYGSNEWSYSVKKALCGWFWTSHGPVALPLAKSLEVSSLT
jgi:hypothetical protein